MTKNNFTVSILDIKRTDDDRKDFYKINILFLLNNKIFQFSYYFDPREARLLDRKKSSNQSVYQKCIEPLLAQMPFLLRIGIDRSLSIIGGAIDSADIYIKDNPSIQAQLPSLLNVIEKANKQGFNVLLINPDYHLWQMTPDGIERHIVSDSIHYVIDELTRFVKDDEVLDQYDICEIIAMRKGYWDVQITPDHLGRFWYVHGTIWHEDHDEPFCYRFFNLRDLESEVRIKMQQSKANFEEYWWQ